MLRAARELLAIRSPLDAELMVSELLGTWWGQHSPRRGTTPRRRQADVEELIGEGLVTFAAQQGSPAALALLSGVACLGTARQASLAERAALGLMDMGVARPGWAEHVGAVESADCYVNSGPLGGTDEVVCVFSYAGEEPHALVVVVDYNKGGMVTDGWVTSQVGKLLQYCTEPAAGDSSASDSTARGSTADGKSAEGAPAGSSSLVPVDPRLVRRLLDGALALTDGTAGPAVSESFPAYHAFIRARIRTLPPPARSTPAWLPGGSAKRPSWSKDRRAMVVAEFLASDEAEDLSDRTAASRCTDHIVDYGCDRDFGRPLRMSPAKAETFLLDWLPRRVVLSPAEQHAMPHVLAAWVRWTGAKAGLGPAAVGRALDAVYDSMGTFTRVYHDPASFGLEPALVARLLPDSDLEALPRRAFAFGVLVGRYRGTDLSTLQPGDHADRRVLLEADHDEPGRPPTDEAHIGRHLALADRLWRGQPPELWDAAQRLLDLGEDRHSVLHTLSDVVAAAGPGEEEIAAALAELPPEESG
jgi:hypothetical protein